MFRHRPIALAVLLASAPAVAASVPQRGELMLIELPPKTDARALARNLAERRGRLIAYFPEAGVALARGGRRAARRLLRSGTGVRVLRGAPAPAQLKRLHGTRRLALSAWSLLAAEPPPEPVPPGGALEHDALTPPDWWDLERPLRAMAAPSPAGARPYGAGWENTSEFLAGSVSLNVILMESDGSVDPSTEDWDATLESQVVAGVMGAADDLHRMYPEAGLSFTVHVFSGRTDPAARTSYEPIARPADPSGTNGEELWVGEILGHLGYGTGSRLSRSRAFADATRVADGTDWAVNVFVADSANDADGRFQDGYFAYAWLGGPHVVLTTDNDGWGVTRLRNVLRHELHHSFYALDEYAGSACSCSAASGYLAGTNDNCENGCGAVDPCVMRNNAAVHCAATAVQVGLLDSDQDGTPDVLAVPPDIALRVDSPQPSCDGLVRLGGTASVVPYPNRNPANATPRRDISILGIRAIEVRVDGSGWSPGGVSPLDGAFGGPVEDFRYEVSLGTGRHQIEARAIDDRGNVSTIASRWVDVAEIGSPVGATLSIAVEIGGTRLRWQPAAGAATYRVYRAADPRGLAAASPVVEVATASWLDTAPGTVFYRVTAVDACGREIP